MLVLEGPDGVGKTTLAKKLLKKLPEHIYAHFSRLPSGFDYYWGYAERMSRYIVQDRFHMSEVVYAKVRGDQTPLHEDAYRLVDAKLRLLGGLTVLITADEDLLRERWDGTKESQMYNLEKSLYAGRLFTQVREGTFAHYADRDLTYHLTRSQPYVEDDAVDEILGAYRRRWLLLQQVWSRQRPAGL